MIRIRPLLAASWATYALSCQSEAARPPVVNVDPAPSANEWKDPVTGSRWTVALVAVTWAEANEACSKTLRLPVPNELRAARVRGICEGRPGCTLAWATGLNMFEAMTYDFAEGATGVRKKDGVAQVFCVEV